MVRLDISYSENSVPKGFSNWVQIHMNTPHGVGKKICDLLGENNLEAALGEFNLQIYIIIKENGGDPLTVTFQ